MTKSRGIHRPRREWTQEELAHLVARYADTPTKALAEALNRAEHVVSQKAYSLGLKKSTAYLASPAACRLRGGDNIGAAYRFAPGQPSWNKGKSMPAVGRSAETQFKKGYLGGRAAEVVKPIGTERVSKDGYLERKVNNDRPFNRRWRAVHLLVWEEAHGPIPEGHAVAFLPGRRTTDPTQITIECLELITRADLMRRNSYHTNYPKEVAELIQLKGALTRKIRGRSTP